MAVISIGEWTKSPAFPGMAVALTTVPPGTRILNPDFSQLGTFWTQYNAGSAWLFQNDRAETLIPAAGDAMDLVNSSGAIGQYSVRTHISLPTTDLTYVLNVYDLAGNVVEVLTPSLPVFGDDTATVNQTVVGRIGIKISNAGGAPMTVNLNLMTTVVKTFLLYQEINVGVEGIRLQLSIPARTGSIRVPIYAFNNPLAPFEQLLYDVNLIRQKEQYDLTVNVDVLAPYKYIGLYTITDYDTTLISYFNANSVTAIWAHDRLGRTNNFYGVQYDSMIDLVLNVQKGQVRIFNSLGIESEAAWSVESVRTSENQISALAEDNFRLRDGIYSAAFMRDMLTPQESLPDPVNNTPLVHGGRLNGVWIKIVLRNAETLRRIELRAVYLGSDELSGNHLAKK